MKKEQNLQTAETQTLNIPVVIKRLWYKFKLWRMDAKYCEIDMDMQCTNMTYKQYCEETDLLKWERERIEAKLNVL